MTLQQLSIFLVVAEERNFTRAAERLFISQPTVSREIMGLEEELQCMLFSRNRRVMNLTEAGKRILPEARSIVESARKLPALARGTGDSVNGCVRIGYVYHSQPDPLMACLAKLFDELPGIELETIYDDPLSANESYRHRKTDILLATRSALPAKHGPLFVLKRSSLAVMVLKGDPLFDRKSIRLEELAGKAMVTTDAGQTPGLCKAYENVCERAGFTPKIVGSGKKLADMKIQMQLHNALSFVSEECAFMADDGLHVIPVEGDFPEFDSLAAVQRKPTSECAEIVTRTLQQNCESLNRTELGDGI